MIDYVSLHNQTHYSILDSLISPKELFETAKELGQKAIAVTDHGSLAAAWECLGISKKTGVKLIIGCECYFVNDVSQTTEKLRHVIFLAKNAVGYRNLLILNKKGFDQGSMFGKRVYPIIDWKLLEKYTEGLICLTACGNGIISQLLMNKKFDEAEATLSRLKDLFGDNLGIEVQPNNMKRSANYSNDEIDQQFLNRRLIDMGKKHNIRVICASNSHYKAKQDSEKHDVFLSIGSHQPVHSNFRLRYNVPDFYIKSGDEVKSFFSRNYGDEYAEQLCANTIYFSDLCEFPDWIDPKFSNPSGKELPIFPTKDEQDYQEFLKWRNNNSIPSDLDEDKAFLRYRCEKYFTSRIKNLNDSNIKEYQDRLAEELDVIEFHGFSSYMLIVADYIDWARNNNIAVGEGRGCLTGDTKVLTSEGFRRLDEIKIGDKVFSHTGKNKEVLNTFKFDVADETLLKFKMECCFGDISLTKDHKIYGSKKISTDPSWIESKNLQQGDFVYNTFPINKNKKYEYVFDLGKWAEPEALLSDKITIKKNIINDFSIREISRQTGLPFELVRKSKNNLSKNTKVIEKISEYLSNRNVSFDSWQKMPKNEYYHVNRFITLDDDFLYILGRWVGDGSIRHNSKNGINFAFNIEDTKGIEFIRNYFEKIGFNVCGQKNNQNGYNLDIGTTLLSKLFNSIFPFYKNSSETKHLPIFFRKLDYDQLRVLLKGEIDSDGHITNNYDTIKTTSVNLAYELKECLNFLKIPTSVFTEKASNNSRNNRESYKLIFSGFVSKLICKKIHGNGYYSRIRKIEEVKSDYVYDITVKDDHSYLTSSGVYHNSVGGSLIAFLLGIHQADPIKYNLIFARFHNKEKTTFPDNVHG